MRLLASLWIACAAMATACGAWADGLSTVREREELVWGGDLQGGEPYVFEDPRDPTKIIGFEVDIAAAIARELGLRGARFFQVQWSNLVPSLERGDIDVALNGLEDTPERRARLRLSRPYFIYHEVLAVRRGTPTARSTTSVGSASGRSIRPTLSSSSRRAPSRRCCTRGRRSPTSTCSRGASTPCSSTTSSPSGTGALSTASSA